MGFMLRLMLVSHPTNSPQSVFSFEEIMQRGKIFQVPPTYEAQEL